jgi:putative Mg2+ transporter-C (MgtC) family protein
VSPSGVTAVYGQGFLQIGELLLAFVLSALIGLERQLRGKSAGLRTQTIVGTTSALMLIVSKYGFFDVLEPDRVVLDPSRVAAQIVSGVGFLGAGLILTRGGTVRGLTTAAAVWETAAIGMAAGAGLWLLALVVTGLHFASVFGFTPLSRRLAGVSDATLQLEVAYLDGRGVLRVVLDTVTRDGWRIGRLTGRGTVVDRGVDIVSVRMALVGRSGPDHLMAALGALEGVRDVALVSEDDLDEV